MVYLNHETLDVRGQLCPIPVIRTQNKIKAMKHGDILTVLCTDPGALHDIPAWCRVHGHKMTGSVQNGREFSITVEIVSESP